jgi:SAM-dependent methyltransferase
LTGLRPLIGKLLLRHARPLRDRLRDTRGTCNVCGETSRHVYNSWILPRAMTGEWRDKRIETAFVRRESLFCLRCGSSLRVRRLVDVLIATYAPAAGTLRELVTRDEFRRLRIAEINSIGVIHPFLASHPQLEYSEYRDDAEPGTVSDGVRNEDVCDLSYDDESFDLVLTSDTLEHVPDFRRALREIRRVLAPGGRHIFTIPVIPSRQETVARVSRGADGARTHHLPELHHGRGSGLLAVVSRKADYLTWTEFGMDVVEELEAAGFKTEVHFYAAGDPDSDAAIVFAAEAV